MAANSKRRESRGGRRRCRVLVALLGASGIAACGGKSASSPPADECTLNPMACSQQAITPIEDCSTVTPSGDSELNAVYAEVRAMHFYKYGDSHPYCEATAHITAYKGVVEHDLALKKLIIRFLPPYADACGREPAFAWHTVAVMPSPSAAGGYLVLDPVYRCRIYPLEDYLQWYVKTDCPDFSLNFTGCASETLDDWRGSKSFDDSTVCTTIEIPAWYYELFNCSSYLGEPWDQGPLDKAFSYVRTDLSGPTDYASRPGASMDDYGCD